MLKQTFYPVQKKKKKKKAGSAVLGAGMPLMASRAERAERAVSVFLFGKCVIFFKSGGRESNAHPAPLA